MKIIRAGPRRLRVAVKGNEKYKCHRAEMITKPRITVVNEAKIATPPIRGSGIV